MENSKFGNLLNQVTSQTPKGVTQKVSKSKAKKSEPQAQLSFYLDKGLFKKLKMKAVEKDTSIKEIMHECITQYLNKKQ